MSHTPGPWIVHGRMVLAPRGQGVDEVVARDCDKANARLIAAAPELLEALKRFAECDLHDGNCASLEVATTRIRNLARAAIAKAEGK